MTVLLIAILMSVSSHIPVRWSTLCIGQHGRAHHDTFRPALGAHTPARGPAQRAHRLTTAPSSP